MIYSLLGSALSFENYCVCVYGGGGGGGGAPRTISISYSAKVCIDERFYSVT